MNLSIDNRIVTVARILSVLLIWLVAVLAIGHAKPGVPVVGEVRPEYLRDALLGSALLAMLAGSAIAWKWEGLGSLLILGGFTGFAIVNGSRTFLPSPLTAFLITGLLFLFCWLPALPLREFQASWRHGFCKAWFYRITLPSIWLVAAMFSWTHPGDEYGLFIISCLPASVLVVVIR